MRYDDIANGFGRHAADGGEQLLANGDAAATIDDGDGLVADDEADIRNVAAIVRGDLRHESLMRINARRDLLHEGRLCGDISRQADARKKQYRDGLAAQPRAPNLLRMMCKGSRGVRRARRHLLLSVGTLLTIWAPVVARAEQPAEPQDYRIDNYRSPTPATLTGARVVDTERAFVLWRDKQALFIDVLPHAPKPPNLPASTVWREKRRDNIPGSLWLPDVGYGALSPETQTYFDKSLAKATAGDRSRVLIFYCLADCWMSWNAARRARSMGYGNIVWYPEGTDGWSAEGHPLQESRPEPRE